MDFSSISQLEGKRVALTGATGFIGQRVLAALLANGAEPTALVRNKRGAAKVMHAGAQAQVCALTDGSALKDAMQAADAVVHIAYDFRASPTGNLAAFDTLLNAAKAANVARFIQMSSVVVYDDWLEADIDATSPVERQGGSPYRQAKMEIEARLMAGDLPAAILQPTLVYGPGSAMWTDGFAAGLKAGGIVLPDPEGLCNAVYVDDVAQAVVRALAVADLSQERFLISGPEPVRWSDFVGGYAKQIGGEIIREPADAIATALGPEPAFSDTISLAARISGIGRQLIGHALFDRGVDTLKRVLGRGQGGPLYPDHHLYGVYTARGACRIEVARKRLGYEPAFDLARGLAATAPYLEQHFGNSE